MATMKAHYQNVSSEIYAIFPYAHSQVLNQSTSTQYDKLSFDAPPEFQQNSRLNR